MALVGKKRLACVLRMDRTTIDAWVARYPDFPVVTRGGEGNIAWQFDVEAVRDFMATKRAEQDQERATQRVAVDALRSRYAPAG